LRASSSGTGCSDKQFDADVPPPEGEVEPTVVEELRTNSLNRTGLRFASARLSFS
jgi:hypothetical protein